MERKTVIEVDRVHKKFKNTEVLKGVTLRCESGKIYGLVGYNGSGKTVLLKCICGFLNYEEGEIRINEKKLGRELTMLPSAGIIIEEPSFLRRWDAYHNLKFLYTICNQNDKAHLCQVLRLVGLDPGSRKPVGKYSLGMKQRLAIAQAVMEGNSHFYVTLDGDSRIYDFALPGMLNVVSYAVGDTITFRYIEGDPTSVAQEIVETAVNGTQDSSGQGGSSASDAEDKDGSDGSASGEESASGQSEEKAA